MIFKLINLRTWPWLAALVSGSLLLGALAFEHIGGYAPCQMCYWQRHAHKAVLALAALTLIMRRVTQNNQKLDRLMALLIAAAFMVSFALAFWHMGVEYKWWEGPRSCSGGANIGTITSTDMLEALKGGAKIPACSDAPWALFTISMAGYNALISGFAAILGLATSLKGKQA